MLMPPYHNMAAVVQDIIFAFPFPIPRKKKNTRNVYFFCPKIKYFSEHISSYILLDKIGSLLATERLGK